MTTLLVDNYDSYTYNVFHILAAVSGEEPIVIQNDTVSWAALSRWDFDAIVISPGPGHPDRWHDFGVCSDILRWSEVPILGICLGHQILGLALGGKTYKLKFGHRGANHPVLNRKTEKVEITSHNHGFAVDPDSLNVNEVDLTHINLNDQTLEGFRHRSEPVFCVQYHPEAAPGPHDSHYLFDDFMQMIKDYGPR